MFSTCLVDSLLCYLSCRLIDQLVQVYAVFTGMNIEFPVFIYDRNRRGKADLFRLIEIHKKKTSYSTRIH